MSYEETLICDECAVIVDAGPRRRMIDHLAAHGGRMFAKGPMDVWVEVFLPSNDWTAARRHLCGSCADATVFFDGTPIPPRQTTSTDR